ncbi:WD40 repeat-like protein [Artomyces pyxidatus]|uniref:WD40 repeat-like protein n=1 Tax=Artomyces pyxidatus TaxID=48021 RepID=A0ACB8T6X1_9AGAM|nr:WD40 repeat-like protein [Artomyces pyxidatus]
MPQVTAASPSYPNDLTAIDPAIAPRVDNQTATGNARRRQTLMTLLNALSELSRDEELGGPDISQQPSFEDDRDVPSVDEHLQKVGAETFHRFQRRINNLDKELRNFSNAARQLGSSVGILSSAFHLRERLTQIAYLFRENAADLFPRKVSHQPKESLVSPNVLPRRRRAKSKAPPHVRRPLVFDGLDPEDFPVQLGLFARDVVTFLHCLNEFPEFTDEAVNASIVAFEGDLKYWASCLKAYEGQFKYPAVQRYLHDLVSEMGEHIESISTSLSMFIEIGVPTIRFAQKHGATNLLNLSTVATFFSAVTATTLQYSFDMTGNPLADAVNAFWFTSMVFSIAAAVNSLLGLTWKQAMYRSPGHRVPWWVLIWIKRSPLVFLVLSVACFSVGLVLFAYSSKQSAVVSTITTVFTAFSNFGLAAVSAWFASERWVFSRHKGKKWLQDSLDDAWDAVTSITLVHFLVELVRSTVISFRVASKRTREAAIQASSTLTNLFSRHSSDNIGASSSENSLPSAASPEGVLTSLRTRRGSDGTFATSPVSEPKSPTIGGSTVDFHMSEKTGSGSPTVSPVSPSRLRFTNAVRSVMMMQQASGMSGFTSPSRSRTLSASLVSPDGVRRKEAVPVPLRTSRAAGLMPKLKGLVATQDLAAHSALVRHLQFSPDGKFLATSSWDRMSIIFHVGDPFTHHRTLAHLSGFVSQVAWSPSGGKLLTKLTRAVKVWTEAGVCTKTIDRHRSVQSICWLPGGEAFMSVEGGDVTKLDLTGKVLDTYHFDRLMIHDVSVTPDGQRLLGVGTLLASGDGLQPSKCRAEKQIIAYNLERKEIENQVPVLHDIRDITLARSGQFALVSYEFKAPPQLWKLEMVKDRLRHDTTTTRLSLRHTYMPKFPVDFAGPSYFGGKDDQLVLCAGKAGDIHIWDRESGSLLHHVRAQALGGDLTCIAWNPAADPFMFATGSHDGAVRIWTSTAPTIPTPEVPPAFVLGRSMRGTPGTVTPHTETSSAFQLDVEYRSESPTTQQDFERAERDGTPRHSESTDDHGGPSSRRTIAFTPPQPFGSMYES